LKRGKELIEKELDLDSKKQYELIQHYANVAIDRKIDIHTRHREILNMIYSGEDEGNLKEKLSLDVMSYLSFLLAIKAIVNNLKHNLSIDEIIRAKIEE